MNPDSDLQARFQTLRHAERQDAPVWNAAAIEAARAPRMPTSEFGWKPVAWSVAAVVLAVAGYLGMNPPPREPTLSEALPVLLDQPSAGAPLFASLEEPVASPSDFLLPEHFRFQIP